MKYITLFVALICANVAYGDTLNSQSVAVVNSYGSEIYPVIQAPAQLLNPVLTDMHTGGVAHTLNAHMLLNADFEPDYTSTATGDSGCTYITCTHGLSDAFIDGKTVVKSTLTPSKVVGTLTIITKPGKGKSVDVSVIRHDVKVFLAKHFGDVVAETQASMMASNYAISTQGKSGGLAESSGFSFISQAISGVTAKSTAVIEPILSITYLLKRGIK